MKARLLTLFAAATAFAAPAIACGPYPYVVRPWNDWAPEDPAAFCAGTIGIPGPRYDLRLAWATWRQLEGLPVGAGCAQAAERAWPTRPSDLWLEARKVVNPEGPTWLDTVRAEERAAEDGSTNYVAYENCLGDAFTTASATLAARVADHGATDPAVVEWLAGQDQVFANCGGGTTIPADANPTWPAWLVADRQYQIAAAHFYSGNWRVAEEHFRAIAAEPQSPWRETAHFVVARTLGRAGRLTEAIAHLDTILADPKLSRWHNTAGRLRDHWRHRAVPEQVREELVVRLANSSMPHSAEQDLLDLRRLLGEDPLGSDPLLGYVRTVTRAREADARVALAQWQATGKTSWWLAAATAHLRVTDGPTAAWQASPEWSTDAITTIEQGLLSRIPAAAGPAALAVTYHHLRLLARAGRLAEAEPQLVAALEGPLSTSDRNRLLDLHRQLAPNLATYLERSLWLPAQHGWIYDDSGYLEPSDNATIGNERFLDDKAAGRLDALGLEELFAAAKLESLPPPITKQLLGVAFVRAVLEGRLKLAVTIATSLAPHASELEASFADLATAPDESRLFAAALTILRAPGLEPHVHSGIGRGSGAERQPLDNIDGLGANWWCAETVEATAELNTCLRQPSACTPPLLLVDHDATGSVPTATWQEPARLPAPLALGPVMLRWADTHRDDPRIPEALHRIVRATRYDCGRGVGDFAEVSKAAFERLHKRYPTSEWTAKTPYWFR